MWELTDNNNTFRMWVPGGWIVKVMHEDYVGHEINNGANTYRTTSSICFFPDPEHEWTL